MLARESNLLLAKPGMVLASYGQWSREQQLPTASYNDLKKEKDKHRRNPHLCSSPCLFFLVRRPYFLLPGLVRFPPLPLPKPGNWHLQACTAHTLERCQMLKPHQEQCSVIVSSCLHKYTAAACFPAWGGHPVLTKSF